LLEHSFPFLMTLCCVKAEARLSGGRSSIERSHVESLFDVVREEIRILRISIIASFPPPLISPLTGKPTVGAHLITAVSTKRASCSARRFLQNVYFVV
jgi:hypothetical protein